MAKKLKLIIDVDANVNDIEDLVDELDNIRNNAGRASKSVGGLQSSLVKIGTTVGGITAVNAAITSSIIAFRELETATAGVAKTTGFSSEEISNLRDNFREMTDEFKGFKTQDLLAIAEAAGQLGIKGVDNISRFTKSMQMVSMTTELTADEASSQFARLSNSLHLPLTKIDNLTSAMNELSNTTTANVGDLVYFSQRMSGVATELGLTASEIGGLSATLKDVGMSAEVASTSMNTVMLGMIKKTKDYAQVIGIPFEEFSTMVKDKPVEALQLFISKLGELDRKSKLKALEQLKLTGDGVTQTMLKLSSNTDLLTKNINIANIAFKEATSIQDEYNAVSNTLDNAMISLHNSIDLAGESLVARFSEPLKGGVDDLTNFISVMSSGEGVIGSFGESLLIFSKLTTAIGGATLAMKMFNIATRANPLLLGVTAAVGTISAVGGYLTSYENKLNAINEKQKVAEASRAANGLDAYGNVAKKVDITKQAALGNAYSSLFQQYNKDGEISAKEAQQLKKIEDQIKATTVAIKKESKALDVKHETQVKLGIQYSKYYDIAMKDDKLSKIEQKELDRLKAKMVATKDLVSMTKVLKKEVKAKRSYTPPIKPAKLKKALSDSKRIIDKFEDEYKKSQLSKHDYSVYLLDKEKEKYKSQNIDKLKIDKWYEAEKLKLTEKSESVWDAKAKEQFNKVKFEKDLLNKASKASNIWSNGSAKKQFESAKYNYDVKELEKEESKKKIEIWSNAVNDMAVIFKSNLDLSTLINKFSKLLQGDKVNASGVGNIMDTIMNADSYAEEGSNIGGAIGGAIGAYFGSPEAGRLAGEWGGLIIGGLFGKTTVTDKGINISGQISQLEDLSSNVEKYTDFKKKSWFKSSEWSKTTALNVNELEQLTTMYDSFDDLLSEFNDRSLGVIEVGKYSNIGKPLVQSFFNGLIEDTRTWLNVKGDKTFDTSEAMTKIWSDYAEKLNSNAIEVIGSKFSELSNQKNVFERWQIGINNPNANKDQAMFDLNIAKRQLDQNNIAGVYVNNYVTKLNEAISKGLTPAELDKWLKFGDSLKKVGEAELAYENILKSEKQKEYDDEISRVKSLHAIKVEHYKKDLSSLRSVILSSNTLLGNKQTNYAEKLYKDALKGGNLNDASTYTSSFIQLSNKNQIGVEAYNKTLSALNDLQLRFGEKEEIQVVTNPKLEEQNSKLLELNARLVSELERLNNNDENDRNMFGQKEVVIVDVA